MTDAKTSEAVFTGFLRARSGYGMRQERWATDVTPETPPGRGVRVNADPAPILLAGTSQLTAASGNQPEPEALSPNGEPQDACLLSCSAQSREVGLRRYLVIRSRVGEGPESTQNRIQTKAHAA